MTPLDTLPTLDVEGPLYINDPDAALAQCREHGDIARSSRGVEILSYEKCVYILHDPRWIPAIGEISDRLRGDGPRMPGNNMLTSEGEIHSHLRMAVQPWFTPYRVEELREKTKQHVIRLLAEISPKGRCDFHRDVANRIPPAVFCWMVGAPESDAPNILAWGEAGNKIFNARPEDMPEVNAAIKALYAYVGALIEKKRQDPGDDLTSVLVAAEKKGLITAPDIFSITTEMLGASSDNVSNSASLLVWLLARHPDQWQKVKADRTLVPSAVEESMRHSPRVRIITHINPAEVTLDGHTFPPRTIFYLHVAAANHDESVYENPERFDVARRLPRSQLVFGVGRHQCLGAALTRMELQVILDVLLDTWAEVKLDGPPAWTVRGDVAMSAMPITFRQA